MRRPRKPSSGRHRTPSAKGTLPDALRERLAQLLGDELPLLEAALGGTPPTSIRINPAKAYTCDAPSVPWCPTGRQLGTRPKFTLDPLLHAGAYYVQEASSMLLEQAFLACGFDGRDIAALDLCAAPGGKSTHLRSLMAPGGLLVANEVDGRRRRILEENLWKWGAANVVIAGSDPADLRHIPGTFDLVLVDAPCSGEGMFRKDPFAREQWSPALVDQCAATQGQLLPHAWDALRPGGVLIYSTCTWEPAEDEEQLAMLQQWGGTPVELDLDPTWGVQPSPLPGAKGYRCYPHRVKGEGFFIGVVRKPGEATGHPQRTVPGSGHADVRAWLRQGDRVALTEREGILHAVDGPWAELVATLGRAMRITAPGIPVAEWKGNGLRPHPALALSTLLKPGVFPTVDLDAHGAMDYLRGMALPAMEAHGVALARSGHTPLGWLQGAGRRWNNRWPAGWRVRMG